MRKYVLIKKGQKTVYGQDAAQLVQQKGFAAAAKELEVGESTLRKYLHGEGFRFSRRTSWQVEHLPGLEELDGDTDVPAPDPGAAEPAGEGGGLGGVEAGGVPAGSEPVGVGAASPE